MDSFPLNPLNPSFPLTIKCLLLSKLAVLKLIKCNTFLLRQTSSQTRTGKMDLTPAKSVKSVFPIEFQKFTLKSTYSAVK